MLVDPIAHEAFAVLLLVKRSVIDTPHIFAPVNSPAAYFKRNFRAHGSLSIIAQIRLWRKSARLKAQRSTYCHPSNCIALFC